MNNPILTIVEMRGASPAKASLEAIGQAAVLAAQCGTEAWALALSPGAAQSASLVGACGAARLVVSATPDIDRLGSAACAGVVARVAADAGGVRAVVIAGTPWGREHAGRIAARLGAAAAIDIGEWRVDGGAIVCTRPVYGGRLMESIALPPDRPAVITVRPNVFPVAPDRTRGDAMLDMRDDFVAGDIVTALADVLVDRRRAAGLAEADVVIGGGLGMGSPEGFAVLHDLADALDGVVGASRAAVDAGWMAHELQIGQTGTSIAPKLYVACAISGAMQHRAGIRNARFIAAINIDPEAPIFRFADAGIVGDIFDIAPKLARAIRERKGSAQAL